MQSHTRKKRKNQIGNRKKYTRKRKRIRARGQNLMKQITNSASESIRTMQ